ncbi:hypothetical protein [Microbispora hainanensis]
MSSVSSSWRRIDAWLAAHAPVTLAMLNPSATPEAVESAQQVLGMRFPDELTESLKCHDGATDWMSLFPPSFAVGGQTRFVNPGADLGKRA